MSKEKKSLPESVYSRLKNIAVAKKRPVQEILRYYAMERFLYRLSVSEYKRTFFLKGGLMLLVWDRITHRATVDIDLLAKTNNSIGNITRILMPQAKERWEGFLKNIGHDSIPLENVVLEIKDFFLPILPLESEK